MQKSKLFLAGMAALLLSFGLVLAGCPTEDDGDGDGGGGPCPSALVGNWVKTGGTDNEKFAATDGHGVSATFSQNSNLTAIIGDLTSYDGTTVQIDTWGGADVTSFTAALDGSTLTIGGLTGDYEHFNGTYTKEGSEGGGDETDGGGDGPGPSALVGNWVKTGGTDNEKFEAGGSHGVTAYFREGTIGYGAIAGEITSYDGTTVQIDTWGGAAVTSFTAALDGSTLTIGGLTGGYEHFNGTYTK
jgi:hypothetical protein